MRLMGGRWCIVATGDVGGFEGVGGAGGVEEGVGEALLVELLAELGEFVGVVAKADGFLLVVL